MNPSQTSIILLVGFLIGFALGVLATHVANASKLKRVSAEVDKAMNGVKDIIAEADKNRAEVQRMREEVAATMLQATAKTQWRGRDWADATRFQNAAAAWVHRCKSKHGEQQCEKEVYHSGPHQEGKEVWSHA